jgi:S1-C subfamily serine protease
MDQQSVYPEATRKEKHRSPLPALVVTLALALALLWSGGFAQFPTAFAQTESPTTDQSSVAQVAEEAAKAVVTITNLQEIDEDFSIDPQIPGNPRDPSGETDQDDDSDTGELVPFASGSGYIIDDEGHIVTNAHVVAGGSDFLVEFYDGTTAEATLVGADDLQDVAVLKLDHPSTVPGTLTFGNSDEIEVGDDVIAIGTPFGEYPNSVTEGDVNGLDRSLDTGTGYRLPNLIQHDASLYPGNSGGPLLNMDGEVIGMNVAKAFDRMMNSQDANIGLAIESNAVKELVDQIIQFGQVERPYLGIRTIFTNEGQIIDSVEPDSPAADAGLEPGDVIKEVDGQAVDEDHPFVNQVILEHAPGDTVTLTVDRDGEEQQIEVTLGTRPSDFQ